MCVCQSSTQMYYTRLALFVFYGQAHCFWDVKTDVIGDFVRHASLPWVDTYQSGRGLEK